MRRQTFVAFLVTTGVTAAVTLGYLLWARSTDAKPTRVDLAALRVPLEFTAGMVQFLTAEEDGAVPDVSSRLRPYPAQEAALWGYYVGLIDQEPWKTRLIQQHSAAGDRVGWPPLPLVGPLLAEPPFRNRILELYVTIDVLPNHEWGLHRLYGLQRSSAERRGVTAQSCSYGEHCCQFTVWDATTQPAQELQRIWLWEEGRLVVRVSALGTPDWPISAASPLLDHYTQLLPRVRGVHDNGRAESPLPSRPVEC